MKCNISAVAIRTYYATVEVNSKKEAMKLAKEMYENGGFEFYEDELTSIEAKEED